MKSVDYDRFIHIYSYISTQDFSKPRPLVVEGTSCNGEVIRWKNLRLEGETTFSLLAKPFSIEMDGREFEMKARNDLETRVKRNIEKRNNFGAREMNSYITCNYRGSW